MHYLIMEDRNVYTIGDIYAQNQQENKKMLSDYPADFWEPYRNNHEYFDRRFKTLYKSWFPYDQEEAEGRKAVSDEFRLDVYAHLMANDKRYAELFRVHTIADNDAYSLVNNVDYTETRQRTEGRDGTDIKGSETITDTGSNVYGSQTVTGENENIKGEREDVNVKSRSAFNESDFTGTEKEDFTSGSQTDSGTEETTFGAHTDNINNTRVDGQRTDTSELDITENESIRKVGNMGIQTVDSMLALHWENWNLFDFYKLIFSDICRDLLRGC